MSKIHIITVSCKRCGKQIAAANRSLYGLAQLKAQYGSICQTCITDDERHELLETMGTGILNQEAIGKHD